MPQADKPRGGSPVGWVALVRQALDERSAARKPSAPTRPVVTAEELAALVAPGRVAAVLGVDLLHLGSAGAYGLAGRPPGLLVAGTHGLVVVDSGTAVARCAWPDLRTARWADAAAADGRPLLAVELAWSAGPDGQAAVVVALAAGFDEEGTGTTDRWLLAVEPHLPPRAPLHRWRPDAEPGSLLARPGVGLTRPPPPAVVSRGRGGAGPR